MTDHNIWIFPSSILSVPYRWNLRKLCFLFHFVCSCVCLFFPLSHYLSLSNFYYTLIEDTQINYMIYDCRYIDHVIFSSKGINFTRLMGLCSEYSFLDFHYYALSLEPEICCMITQKEDTCQVYLLLRLAQFNKNTT